MWVESTPNGKFKACERYTDPLTGKLKKVSVTIDKDTKQARKAAADVLRDKIKTASVILSDADLTLEELGELYLCHQKKFVREQTIQRDTCILHLVVNILGKDVKASSLSARYITKKLDDTGKENVTLNNYLKHIKKMLRWAYSNDYIDDVAYLSKIKSYPDKEKKARIEDKYLSSDELKALLDGMKEERWKLLTHFLALSGLRIGEAIALLNEDVTKFINVCKTANVINGHIHESAKTDAGNREVFIQPELADVIKKMKAFVLRESLKYKFRTDIFFPYRNGDYIKYPAYLKYLRENSIATIGRKITPHALRHTHVSLLAENGIPLDVISRRVGHEDSDITREIYLHITEKQKEKDNQMISQVRII